jgi:hypothetical protein
MKEIHQDIFDDAFDRRIKALMDEWQIPGAAIVLIKDGEAPSYRTLSGAGYSQIKPTVSQVERTLVLIETDSFPHSVVHQADLGACTREGSSGSR